MLKCFLITFNVTQFEQNFIASKVFQPIKLGYSLTRGLQTQGIALINDLCPELQCLLKVKEDLS